VFVASLTIALAAPAQDLSPPSAPMSGPQITFAFDRPGLTVPQYELTIRRDGSAVYAGEELPSPVGPYPSGPDPTSARPAQTFRSVVSISPATVGRVFALAQKLNHFNVACASKAKNMADTGTKKLTYTAPDGSGSCTYNYSENKDVETLTQTFEGIAETMDAGRHLDYLHRYDRLGLDAAMISLAEEVSAGRALEVGTIAPSLTAISQDAMVIQRVRGKADSLLTLVPAAGQPR